MHDIECGFHLGSTSKGTIFFHGEFLQFNDSFEIVVGNYNCKLSYYDDYELQITCVPNIYMLPQLSISITGFASHSRLKNCLMINFDLRKIKYQHMLGMPNILPKTIEISSEYKNSEELRFKYMINEGIDIAGIEFMSYEEFIRDIFIKANLALKEK